MADDFTYPADGRLRQYFISGDFLDGQSVAVADSGADAIDFTVTIFSALPHWVNSLLALRDWAVRPFGLKTRNEQAFKAPTREELEELKRDGVFAVHAANAEEVILGTNDAHLDFRVSILSLPEEGRVSMSTWVRPHNGFGKAYLIVVYPFHRVIVRRCLATVENRHRGRSIN